MKAVPISRWIVFFALAVGGCAVDMASKRAVFSWLGMPDPRNAWWVWKGVFGFQTSLNEGALFGIGQGMVKVFAGLSLAAAAAVLYWLFCVGAARSWLLTVALGCVTAGIFGNLYDRLGLPGLVWNYSNALHRAGEPVYAVRDWIQVMIGTWPWPTFNIADSLLVCGAAMLVWHATMLAPAPTVHVAGGETEGSRR